MAGTSAEKPNIRQVAQLAGVSHMTVSRVMNDYPHIKEATRKRVLDVIEELGYRPNQAARALATQRNRRIGVLVESAVSFGPMSTLRSVEFAARTAGYAVNSIGLHDGDEVTPQEAIEHLTAQGIDALCVVAPRSSSLATIRKIPIGVPVLVVKPDKDPAFLTISVDQQQGTVLAVDHLVSLGHRDILHLAGPLDWLDARARERAFHARAKEWGIRQRPIVVGDWSADFAYDYAKGLRELPEFTAVFAANDDMAVGLVHGLHDRGFSVPGDISVIGFDDISLAAHVLPPLTTVHQNFHSLGVSAVDMLRAAIEEREIPHVTRIPADLVVRSSTAAPREERR
ncbi:MULTISPECIES: LacI family DNA-binding transcriptional regulator [unclassified Microbacterium]|uniref:LacI family DNA-binding transcriptional regulator n=2 Tax=Microbacterium TaxID=33882 RepID=UPI00097F41D0|nr:LacI family DNA-binding transcriptional regulator [Microbacterium sp. JB110]RCS60489.1 LacI family DNA-binding transcriptional regulator [Microbacterium sp. JB110]SJM46842.1 Transcriptional regulator, LacI family [Frigoribacterium sp. JB110]